MSVVLQVIEDFHLLYPTTDTTALAKGLSTYSEAIYTLAQIERNKQRTPERRAPYDERIKFYTDAGNLSRSFYISALPYTYFRGFPVSPIA